MRRINFAGVALKESAAGGLALFLISVAVYSFLLRPTNTWFATQYAWTWSDGIYRRAAIGTILQAVIPSDMALTTNVVFLVFIFGVVAFALYSTIVCVGPKLSESRDPEPVFLTLLTLAWLLLSPGIRGIVGSGSSLDIFVVIGFLISLDLIRRNRTWLGLTAGFLTVSIHEVALVAILPTIVCVAFVVSTRFIQRAVLIVSTLAVGSLAWIATTRTRQNVLSADIAYSLSKRVDYVIEPSAMDVLERGFSENIFRSVSLAQSTPARYWVALLLVGGPTLLASWWLASQHLNGLMQFSRRQAMACLSVGLLSPLGAAFLGGGDYERWISLSSVVVVLTARMLRDVRLPPEAVVAGLTQQPSGSEVLCPPYANAFGLVVCIASFALPSLAVEGINVGTFFWQ